MSTNTSQESVDSVSTPAGARDNPTPNTKKRRNRKRGKDPVTVDISKQTVGTTGSNGPGVDSGFSSGDSFLETVGISISGRVEQIRSVPKTDGYFKLVTAAYNELVATKTLAGTKLSYAEWRHIHALMLYGRIANVEFDATGFKQPGPTRITLPNHLRVYHPIFSALAHLGTVEDSELFTKYIPHCHVPQEDDLTPDDYCGILDCTMYPWADSWEKVLEARNDRVTEIKPTVGYSVVNKEKFSDLDEFQSRKQQLAEALAQLNKVLKLVKTHERDHSDDRRSLSETDWTVFDCLTISENSLTFEGETVELKSDEINGLFKTVLQEATEIKYERFVPHLTNVETSIVDWKFEDNTVVADPGAYGRRLGWDPLLWKDYEDFVDIVSPVALFSISFPKDTKGTYAWLLPVKQDNSGFFVALPKPLPTNVWCLALIIDGSTLNAQRVEAWYGETDRSQNPNSVRVGFVKKGIKSGVPVEAFRYT